MGDNINVDWNAWSELNPNYNALQTQAGADALGLQQGQQSYSALQGVDLSNPQSLGNAINNSARAGNIAQATALIGVARAKTFYDLGSQQLTQNQGAPPAQVTTQPSAKPQTQSQPQTSGAQTSAQPSDGNITMPNGSQVNQQAALAHTQKISSEIDNALALPQDQRAAYIAKVAPDLGFTADQVSNFQPTDDNLNQLKNEAQAHNQFLSGNVINQSPDLYPPQLPQAAALMSGDATAMTGAYKLNHPDLQMIRDMPGYGYDPIHGQLVKLASDEQVASQAGIVSNAQETGKIQAENANTPRTFYLGANTLPPMTQTQANALIKQGVPITSEISPETKAAATGMGEFRSSMHEIPGTDANGRPVTVSMLGDDYLAARAAGVPISKLGMAPSSVDVDWQNAGQASLRKVIDAASTNIQNYPKDDYNNHQLLTLANAVGTGPYSKVLSTVAQNIAPILGNSDIKEYASNVPLLAQTLSNYTRSQFSTALPRIRSEFDTLTNGLPKDTSPQDQIKIDALLNIANRNYNNEMNQNFVSNSDNLKNRSTEGAQLAWDNQQGGRSILSYALPDLQKTTINGKPAISAPIEYQGHHWAQFLPGSSHPMKIRLD